MEARKLDDLLKKMDQAGEQGRAAREYISQRRIRVSLRRQSTGARWTLLGNIQLNPSQLQDEAYALSLVVHEVCHLKQGILKALSVQGELIAWREQFACLKSLTGRYTSSSASDEVIAELMQLCPDDRANLRRARILMQKFAGGKYRIHWLPLYPLGREIKTRILGDE